MDGGGVEVEPEGLVRVAAEGGVGAGDDDLVAEAEMEGGDVAGGLDGVDLGGKEAGAFLPAMLTRL